ncbi:MurR/RpiR family transcriptional regulator [Rhizobium leguminosarum]|uniref:MurR/RpiR family transcriptional regulator n=1 Tax=Rhizobium leguminosarum TaxID=384 RepID=UPI00103076D3|nr:MurR/RpiR family transcriptional regulator [Rhizobium leguminosarum]TAZ44275.1 MurR/RpiR family transcriptional regulator [Rhizobium leguminosarum]
MTSAASFADVVASRLVALSRTEKRVAQYFVGNQHQVLVQSAMELAGVIGTSDATVIRTTKALGFDGLDGMRRWIADELRRGPNPATRLSRTIEDTGGELGKAFEATLGIQTEALAGLRATVKAEDYAAVVRLIAEAPQALVFGIGPSASIAEYFCIQLRRFGVPARPMNQTGLLLADQILALQPGDLVMIMAYGRVYAEVEVLIRHANSLGLQIVLITDSLEETLRPRVSRVLNIARGRIDAFSLHTVTLAFLENLLVGVATLKPQATLASLEQLNALRAELARGDDLDVGHPNLPSQQT